MLIISRLLLATYRSVYFVVLGVIVFVGCATSRPIVGPDGSEHQLISCGAIEMCYEKATAVCAGTYKIVNTNSEVSGGEGTTSTTVKMLVKCGK